MTAEKALFDARSGQDALRRDLETSRALIQQMHARELSLQTLADHATQRASSLREEGAHARALGRRDGEKDIADLRSALDEANARTEATEATLDSSRAAEADARRQISDLQGSQLAFARLLAELGEAARATQREALELGAAAGIRREPLGHTAPGQPATSAMAGPISTGGLPIPWLTRPEGSSGLPLDPSAVFRNPEAHSPGELAGAVKELLRSARAAVAEGLAWVRRSKAAETEVTSGRERQVAIAAGLRSGMEALLALEESLESGISCMACMRVFTQATLCTG